MGETRQGGEGRKEEERGRERRSRQAANPAR
jgi:hypothetical protein